MNKRFIKWFMALNSLFIRLSGGQLGSKLGKQTILILHTVGRSSGKERAIPIAYFFKDGKYLIVASNWGKDNHADWYLNLKKNPQAKLEVNGKLISVMAHEAQADEYDHLWKYLTERHPLYADYQKMTTRRIPVMVFEQTNPAA